MNYDLLLQSWNLCDKILWLLGQKHASGMFYDCLQANSPAFPEETPFPSASDKRKFVLRK